MTSHIEAKKEDIADIVLMPGDPLRAKYIADNFLEKATLITSVRNILGYTGTYKGKKITTMASGMGIPSIGIYCYELFKFYDVNTIIRIGSCGTFSPEIGMFETILIDKSYSESNFALSFNNEDCHISHATKTINDIIEKRAKEMNINCFIGDVLCNEAFDPYVDNNRVLQRAPDDLNIIASEMEAFALFYIAKYLNKNAACLLTVVDSLFNNSHASAEDRQNALNDMIKLALESSLEI